MPWAASACNSELKHSQEGRLSEARSHLQTVCASYQAQTKPGGVWGAGGDSDGKGNITQNLGGSDGPWAVMAFKETRVWIRSEVLALRNAIYGNSGMDGIFLKIGP